MNHLSKKTKQKFEKYFYRYIKTTFLSEILVAAEPEFKKIESIEFRFKRSKQNLLPLSICRDSK